MRVALISHGLPPHERTGVETHVAHSAAALVRAGQEVLVFARRSAAGLPHLAERRERRDGYAVHWLHDKEPTRNASEAQDPPGVAAAFAEFLDRERPDLCHFHHLRGLGPACVAAARERGIPTVFTAHDLAALCHRTVMLRPDLARCTTVADPAACARCDLATSFLNGLPGLGDWQAGVEPAQLAAPQRESLAALLEGAEPPGLEPALETRRALEAERLAALRSFDLVLAPSAGLAGRLRSWGLDPERIRPFECGIETAELRGLPAVWPAAGESVRFGFIGGASKHKGLEQLLLAFGQLRAPARLSVHADASDRPHVARLRELAREVGAEWRGAFEAHELPARLSEIDVLCVPSRWEENAPFVVREAFAAGRPVVASGLGGLRECVRDGRDGKLVAATGRAAWSEALEALAGNRERVLQLAAGIEPPTELEDSTRALVCLHEELLERRARPAPRVLPHLRAFEERFRVRTEEPLDALGAFVAEGLDQLAAGLGLPAPGVRLEGDLRDQVRDERRRVEWLERGAADDARVRAELGREVTWLRAELRGRDAELAWLRERLGQVEGEAKSEAAGREEALASLRAVEAEYTRTAADLEALRRHERWLAGEAQSLAAELGAPSASSPASSPAGLAGLEPAALARALEEARRRLAELASEVSWRRDEMEAARGEGGRVLRGIVRRSGLGRRMSDWGGEA